jgi:hypothetical protein
VSNCSRPWRHPSQESGPKLKEPTNKSTDGLNSKLITTKLYLTCHSVKSDHRFLLKWRTNRIIAKRGCKLNPVRRQQLVIPTTLLENLGRLRLLDRRRSVYWQCFMRRQARAQRRIPSPPIFSATPRFSMIEAPRGALQQ